MTDSAPSESFIILPSGATLQIIINSTSLGDFKFCPRYYQYVHLLHWTTKRLSVHLWFGIEMHAGVEHYHKIRADGAGHQVALREAVRLILTRTWDRELNRPVYYDDTKKNRFTLIRTLVLYLDKYQHDPVKTVILPDGSPAVELLGVIDSGIPSRLAPGRNFILVVHLDRLGQLTDDFYITDVKTTGSTVNDYFFDRFTPDNQFSFYTHVGAVAWHVPVRGIVADAAQTAVGFSEFKRGLVSRSESFMLEWTRDLRWWLSQLESCVEQYPPPAWWPANDKSCERCGFRRICSMDPGSRLPWLQAEFTQRVWDPLTRGEV